MTDELAGTALAATALALVDFGARRGLRRADLLRAAGLDAGAAADPDGRVPVLALIALWRELLVAFPDEIVPLALVREAERLPIGILGPLGRTVASARQLLELGTRYSRLVDSGFRSELISAGGQLGVTVGHQPEVEALGFPLESMAAWLWRTLHDIAGNGLVVRVTFAHRPRHPVAGYQAFFGVPVEVGAPRCALWLAPGRLDAPLAARDDDARRYLEAHAARLIDELPAAADPFVTRARTVIAEELATSGAELERVARRLATSTRTLQRRLGEAGTTFQALVDEVRRAAAVRLLRDRERTILAVAFELGYADLQGFYRAFKRWTGQTPAEWRRGAGGEAFGAPGE